MSVALFLRTEAAVVVVFVNPYLIDKASGQLNAIYAKHFEIGNFRQSTGSH